MHAYPVKKLVNLLDPAANLLFGVSQQAAEAAVASGDPSHSHDEARRTYPLKSKLEKVTGVSVYRSLPLEPSLQPLATAAAVLNLPAAAEG